MKRGTDNRRSVERTATKDKGMHDDTQHPGRPNSSHPNTPNRGLNEDEQKQRTNQDEEDETTNAYAETSGRNRENSDENRTDEDRSPIKNSDPGKKY